MLASNQEDDGSIAYPDECHANMFPIIRPITNHHDMLVSTRAGYERSLQFGVRRHPLVNGLAYSRVDFRCVKSHGGLGVWRVKRHAGQDLWSLRRGQGHFVHLGP